MKYGCIHGWCIHYESFSFHLRTWRSAKNFPFQFAMLKWENMEKQYRMYILYVLTVSRTRIARWNGELFTLTAWKKNYMQFVFSIKVKIRHFLDILFLNHKVWLTIKWVVLHNLCDSVKFLSPSICKYFKGKFLNLNVFEELDRNHFE